MSSTDVTGLPDLAEILSRVLERVPPERRPLLVAIAERLAAERYRGWASDADSQSRAAQLLACATREEAIVSRIAALYSDGAEIQRDILSKNPDLEEINRSIFAGRPLAQQFTIQANGERLGAATWRAFAQGEQRPDASQTFLSCAELDEQNARVLEAILQPER